MGGGSKLRSLAVALAVTGAVAFAPGCELFKSAVDKSETGYKETSGGGGDANTLKGDENFEGFFMTLTVDGVQTKTDKKKDPAKGHLWQLASHKAGGPEFVVKWDHAKLGELKKLDIQWNPLKGDGSIDYGTFYKPEEPLTWSEGKPFKVGKVVKITEKFDALPAGKYALGVTVTGDKNWDRQTIYLDVK